MGLAAIPATMLVGKWALTLLYTSEYAEHLDLLMLFVAAAGINAGGVFLGFGLGAAHVFREQLLICGASTFASFAFSLLLVPWLGLMGAGIALMISAMVSLIGAGIVLDGVLRHASKQS
jgi:O-antigen/teichoic acid export membrane protein